MSEEGKQKKKGLGGLGSALGNVTDQVGEVAGGATEQVGEATGQVGEVAGEVTDQVGEATQGVPDTAGQTLDQVSQTTEDLSPGLQEVTKQTQGAVGQATGQV